VVITDIGGSLRLDMDYDRLHPIVYIHHSGEDPEMN